MSIRKQAILLLQTFSEEDKKKLKVMLDRGILCYTDYAIQHHIDPHQFSAELKAILGGD